MKTILVLLLAAGLLPRSTSAQSTHRGITENARFADRIPSPYGWLPHGPAGTPKFPDGFSRFPITLTMPLAPMAGIPQDYYARHWGMMCRFEWHTYQRLKVPLSIRLGTLEYENRLEGKP